MIVVRVREDDSLELPYPLSSEEWHNRTVSGIVRANVRPGVNEKAPASRKLNEQSVSLTYIDRGE